MGGTFHKVADDDDKRLWLKQRRTVTENQHAASGFIYRQQDVKRQVKDFITESFDKHLSWQGKKGRCFYCICAHSSG